MTTVVSVLVDDNVLFDKSLPEGTERRYVRGGKSPNIAEIYNREMDKAMSRYIIFCHPDVLFPPETTGIIERSLIEPGGIIGLVGVDEEKHYFSSNDFDEPKDMATVDSCFMAMDRESGLRFDSQTFNGFHLYIEDVCCQARAKGMRCWIPPLKGFEHKGVTYRERGACWGNYPEYHGRLTRKWEGKVRVVTT